MTIDGMAKRDDLTAMIKLLSLSKFISWNTLNSGWQEIFCDFVTYEHPLLNVLILCHIYFEVVNL